MNIVGLIKILTVLQAIVYAVVIAFTLGGSGSSFAALGPQLVFGFLTFITIVLACVYFTGVIRRKREFDKSVIAPLFIVLLMLIQQNI